MLVSIAAPRLIKYAGMRMPIAPFVAMLGATCAFGQFAPPNNAGVSLGHIHLLVKDISAQEHFFTEMMGGAPLKGTATPGVEFPGIWIMFRQGNPTAPPAGSIVNHFGLVFRDLSAMLSKWKSAGVEIEQNANPNQGYVHAPDGVRIEFFGDPTLPVPVRMDHVHSFTTDVAGMQEWYSKVFGLVPGKRPRVSTPGWVDCVFLFPGTANLSFQQNDMKQAPTKGRSIDHIGFEVKNIDKFVKRIEAQGIRLDQPVQSVNATTKNAFLTDPWGTYIELTEHSGLRP